MQRRGRLRRLVSRSGADAILLSAPKESVSARKPIFTAAGHRPVSPARSLEPLSELDVAVPPDDDTGGPRLRIRKGLRKGKDPLQRALLDLRGVSLAFVHFIGRPSVGSSYCLLVEVSP